jgi:metal-sulfur cluster biosynthetic enzyme
VHRPMDTAERDFEQHDERPSEAPSEASDGAPARVEDRILESLKDVIDPELGINIVDLGLVYDVQVEDDTVRVEYTLTTMGCPIGPMIESQMQQSLKDIEGVDNLQAELVFSPPWSPEKMSDEAKAALGII